MKDTKPQSPHHSAASLPAKRDEHTVTPASLRVDTQSFTTRTLTVFEATGGPLNRKYYYCRSKHPLAPAERIQFAERMERLSALPLPALKVRNFGIDEVGFAFIITEQGNTKPLIAKAPRPPEQVTQIVEEVIDILSTVHEAGLTIGDVSQDTFRLDNQNRVVLAGTLGLQPPNQTLESLGADWLFLSPQEAKGEKPSFAGDVFAIVALVYRLITGKHYSTTAKPRVLTEQDFERIPRPSTVPHLVPEWADEFIASVLQYSEKDRPATGSELKEQFFKQAYPKAKLSVSIDKLYAALLGVKTEAIRAAGFFVSFVTFLLVALWLKQEGLLPQITLSAAAPKIVSGSVDLKKAKTSAEDVLGALTGGNTTYSQRLEAAKSVGTSGAELDPLAGAGSRTKSYIESLKQQAEANEGSTTDFGDEVTVGDTKFIFRNKLGGPLLLTFADDTGWWEAVVLGLLTSPTFLPEASPPLLCQIDVELP